MGFIITEKTDDKKVLCGNCSRCSCYNEVWKKDWVSKCSCCQRKMKHINLNYFALGFLLFVFGFVIYEFLK